MQTILGSGGAIGTELAKNLPEYTTKIRLVSRNPQPVNPTDDCFSANLLDSEAVRRAVAGSEVVYLVAGLEYDHKVWQRDWPIVMANAIAACQEAGAKLVFFDNIYMCDPDYLGHLTEEAPMRPISKKGMVRRNLVNMLMAAVEKGTLTASIARAADFYGPGVRTSVLQEVVPKPLAAGKKANWLCSLDQPHSFTYAPDAGRATALLGNTPDSFNQIWHVPTAPDPWTGRQWINAFAEALGVPPKSQVAGKAIVRLLGLFNPIMRETVEMLYQYDRPYVFDSSKFSNRFGIAATPYADGLKAIMAAEFSDAV